jgi:hypothetical protein
MWTLLVFAAGRRRWGGKNKKWLGRGDDQNGGLMR